MNATRHRTLVEELRRAILQLSGEEDFQGLSNVRVEQIQDADGDAALRAVLVLPDPGPGGWPVELNFTRSRRVNQLAADRELDEYVYLSLFSPDEYREMLSDQEAGTDSSADDAIESRLREQGQTGEGDQ